MQVISPAKLHIACSTQERIMTSFLFGREEEERVTGKISKQAESPVCTKNRTHSGVARVQQLPGHLVGVSPPHSRGVWGHALPENFLNFRCSEVHSGAF